VGKHVFTRFRGVPFAFFSIIEFFIKYF